MKVAVAAIAIALVIFGGAAKAGPSVTVNGVTIDGTVSPIDASVNDYFGIPYATAARWTPPAPHAPLNNPFDASNFSKVNVCPQSQAVVISGFTLPQSEDCLSLNVREPKSATPTSKLPVYFFIHGGSLQTETGVDYFADEMAGANDIVVVTINYRLGALGWLAQKALAAGKGNAFENAGDAGNYGLMDQQFALQWVNKNIAAFGGDPRKVTIGGQSAGGLSVGLNLASTTIAKGLFRAAVIESGAYLFYTVPSEASYESVLGNPYVNAVLSATGTVGGVNCSTLTTASPQAEIVKCLDGATVATLLAKQAAIFGGFGISPDSGTLIVPNGLHQAFSAGEFIRVPVLQGVNANEGRYFEPAQIPFAAGMSSIVAAGGPANYDLANANAYCGGSVCTYEKEINLFLAGSGISPSVNTASFDSKLSKTDYPVADFPDQYLAGNALSADEGLAQIGTDLNFACDALDSETELAGFTTLYAYEFNDPLAPPITGTPAKSPNDQYGYPTASEHGAELQFLFDFPNTGKLSADEQTLETAMQNYWANFVKSLNPGKGATVPRWPAFNTRSEIQKLVPGPAKSAPFKTFGKEHFCTVWQPIISAE